MPAPLGIGPRLAIADAAHEWRISLCLVLAVAAIASPLLLFFGLKHGTMDTLRKRLLSNPATLELVPVTEKLLDSSWFDKWRNTPGVAFVVPRTRKLSAQADVALSDVGIFQRLDIHPSLPGDVLLKQFALAAPANDACVLTSLAAERLKAKVGDSLAFTVTREQGRAKASHTFAVAGILPPRASSIAAAYIPLPQLEYIEDYKDGRAVPAFGWPGNDPVAYAVARGAILCVPDELDAKRKAILQLNTGFTGLESLGKSPLQLANLPALPSGMHVYRLRCIGRQATQENFGALKEKLRGLAAVCIPVFDPVSITISNGRLLNLAPATGYEDTVIREAMDGVMKMSQWTDFSMKAAPRVLLVSADANETGAVEATLSDFSSRYLRFQARVAQAPGVPAGTAYVPQALLGQLQLFGDRALADGRDGKGHPAFLLGRRGYSSFRMYAAGPDNVAAIARLLEADDIRVTTQIGRIEELKRLDRGLSLLFWLIAAASSVGGMACLLSSIYANVERKRKDFAALRLLGMHGFALGAFPLTSSLILTLSGMALSLILFHFMAAVINIIFASQLGEGEAFCDLGVTEQGIAILAAAGLAAVAGLAASRRLTSIDPSESLRDE